MQPYLWKVLLVPRCAMVSGLIMLAEPIRMIATVHLGTRPTSDARQYGAEPYCERLVPSKQKQSIALVWFISL